MSINAGILLFCLAILSPIYGLAAKETPFRECANSKPSPLSIRIENCSDLPCETVQGERFHIAIQFLAMKDTSTQLSADVSVRTTTGLEIPFDLDEPQRNVCNNLLNGAYCPLYATEDVTFDLAIVLNNSLGRSVVEVNLQDEVSKEVVACFITEVHTRTISPKFRFVNFEKL
uniref:Epididymal secretory protein E1 n=1 Tax=Zeugodacus cucurbitae TaxID=28588 RepID=A0A0A1XBB5_ZEUCU